MINKNIFKAVCLKAILLGSSVVYANALKDIGQCENGSTIESTYAEDVPNCKKRVKNLKKMCKLQKSKLQTMNAMPYKQFKKKCQGGACPATSCPQKIPVVHCKACQ